MADYPIDALQCDRCGQPELQNSSTCKADTDNNCLWIPKNNENNGECSHKCKARLTKGECEQYLEWNKSELSPVIYDFSGNDNECIWHPNDYSIDDTHSSMEGVCRAKDSKCFETEPGNLQSVDNDSLGEVYCGYYYGGHDNGCYNYTVDTCTSLGGDKCQLYTDPRMDEFSGAEFSGAGSINKGYCISDGKIRYDLETGEELGLIKTDEECSQIKQAENCIGQLGNGCLWEPVKQYCIPKVPQPESGATIEEMYNSCKPIHGHLPGNYDLNLLEEEGINVSEYRDRDNKKFPYYTSKYLCDVCSIRDNDLDNMYDLNVTATNTAAATDEEIAAAQNKLNYYMIKDYIDFGIDDGGEFTRSSTQRLSPQEYCEKVIDDTYDIFNPCIWDDTDTSSKGGKCVSKCSQHSPVDSSVVTSRDLKIHKEECLSERWFPEESVRDIQFPNLNRGAETTEDYFNDRYCTWDGYECHNSIPCKFAQQTRCEDLGYDWYEGTAVDIMSQPNAMGIPVDLSSSYPIVRKGDGKPVEGDMEGVCIYPNVEAGFIAQPQTYIINPQYVGEQVIMIKWREYGSGWWEDNSCKRKIIDLKIAEPENTDFNNVNNAINNKSYFLGENVALIPFRIEQGDKCVDIKLAINNALQSYQYFVYNGEWVVYAEDVVHAIERSYDSSIVDPQDGDISSAEAIYKKYYGYYYYSEYDDYSTINSKPALDDNERKILNAIYDLRGAINILPVLNGQCLLEITNFDISSTTGDMTLTVKPTDNNTKFEFVEFIGTDIFTEDSGAQDPIIADKLTLNVLSKYNYDGPKSGNLPSNIVEGYGTLYENKMIEDIEENDLSITKHTHGLYEKFRNLTNEFIDALDGIKNDLTTDNQAVINSIIRNRPTQEVANSPIEYIKDISITDPDIIQQQIDDNNLNMEDWITNYIKPNINLDTVNGTTLIKDYLSNVEHLNKYFNFNIRSEYDFNRLKELIRKFIPGPVGAGDFAYTEDEYKNWAAYVEFKNFNVFSHPNIEIKSELNKAKCKHRLPPPADDPGEDVYLCSGSLESWKINNPVRKPTYQAINLTNVDGLLKLMARYLDQDTLFVNGSSTKENGEDFPGLQDYINSYQKTDLTKCVLWSITRNTPPFWGNLFYNKRDIIQGDVVHLETELYICSGNYNSLDDVTEDRYEKACYGKEDFHHDLGDNTLIKPFCELGGELDQKIKWKNIMSYTGGNKREIQLSRNVSYENYNDYIRFDNLENFTLNGNKIAVDTTHLNTKLGFLDSIINESKKEYVLRSLLDWKRIPYDSIPEEPGSGVDYCKVARWKKTHLSDFIDEYIDNVFAPATDSSGAPVEGTIDQGTTDNTGYVANLRNTISNDHNLGTRGNFNDSFSGFDIGNSRIFPGYNKLGLNRILSSLDTEYSTFKSARQGNRSFCGDTTTEDGNWWEWRNKITNHDKYDENGAITNKGIQGDNYYWGWMREGNNPDGLKNLFGYIDTFGFGGGIYRNKDYSRGNLSCSSFEVKKDVDGDEDSGLENRALNEVFWQYQIANGVTTDDNLYDNAWYFSNSIKSGNTWQAGFSSSTRTQHLPVPSNENLNYVRDHILDPCCGITKYPACPITPSNYTGDAELPDNHIFKITHNDYTLDFTDVQSRITELDNLNIVESFDKLSHINNSGELMPWIYTNDLSQTQAITENDTIINNLYYPITSYSGEKPNGDRADDDKLRAWCMSNSNISNPGIFDTSGNMVVNSYSGNDILNKVNPDNPEKNSGILYNNWYNRDGDKEVQDNTEIFDKGWSDINAYVHPDICEPWLLKAALTPRQPTDPYKVATYDNSLFWSHWNNYDSLNSDHRVDFWKINNGSGDIQLPDTDVSVDSFYGTTKPELYNSGGVLYSMLYPLSITAARPKEKFIYVDITPNNNIFDEDNSEIINTKYLTQYQSDAGEGIFEQDYTNDNYFYRPGDSYTMSLSSDIANQVLGPLPVTTGTATPRKIKLLIGGNYSLSLEGVSEHSILTNATDISDITNTDLLKYVANHHVAYFKKIKELQSGTTPKLNKNASNIYKFTFTGDTTNMKYNPSFTDDIFYKHNTQNKLFDKEYYQHRLPQKASITKSIKSDLFGTGLSNPFQGPSEEGIDVRQADLRYYTFPTNTDRPIIKYFNVNMRFNSERSRASNDETIEQIEICKDIVRSKLSRCGNPNNWDRQDKSGCNTCFGVDSDDGSVDESTTLCSNYASYIYGDTEMETSFRRGVPPTEVGSNNIDIAISTGLNIDYVGVCDILDYNRNKSTPWDYIDVVQEPDNYGMNLPANSPYDHDNRTCDNINNLLVNTDIEYIPLYHAGVNTDNHDTGTVFFKNVRNNVSDIFESSVSDPRPYGCIRKGLSLMDVDNIKLSCNTNLASAVERDKHVLINYIIQHSPELNTSQRTKLAIMSYEELLNKALSIELVSETGELLNIGDINEYTRPKVYKKQRDVKIDNICEISGNYCEEDTDCDAGEKCGRYEQWNDLQRYYYNIDNEGPKSKDYTMRKEWYMGGCGLDLNYSDSSSGESICKDKYPGLCEKNIDKCNSDNQAVREAIMLDCPETCQVQYTDFDRYKTNQVGELSICTARGRCKWSQDPDESNLLPPCEEHTTREMGSVEKCRKYNLGPSDGGPDAGSCNIDEYPQTLASPICAEQRCTSMQGCLFTKPKTRYCKVESYVDDRIVNEEDCPSGSRCIGTSPGGQCIMPYKEFYDSDLQDFEQDCSMLGGTIIDGQEQSCEYIPDLPYTGEDPCTHLVDLDDLTEDEQRLYLFTTKGTPIYIHEIRPESFNGEEKEHPDYIKIILDTTLNSTNITDYENLDLTDFPRDKYIYIDNNTSDNNSICSQYLLGKSKIVNISNYGEGGTANTEIIIGGPNKAYILPRHTEDSPDGTYKMGDIDIGGSNACQLIGIYDIESYFTNNTNGINDEDTRSVGQRKSDACYYNPRGACNYEISGDELHGNCVSCSLYKDEVSCFGNNEVNQYSRCGWGSIKDMCEVIGEMDECKKMHIDGCEWDPAKEKCSLNKLTDDDGNPLVDKVGCVKCDDIRHRNTCNSMKNCFWDRLTETTDGIGRCRACSNIGDPTNGTGDSNKGFNVADDQKRKTCDDYQITEGQCEFRNPENRVSGLDSDLHIFSSDFLGTNSITGKILNSWKIIFEDVFLDANQNDEEYANECEQNQGLCKCSPTRLYPFFPDWIIHNLIFLLIFGPFIVYFGYAWYKVLISPCVFDVELETIDNTADKSKPDVSELLETLTDGIAKKLKEEVKEGSKEAAGAMEEAVKEATDAIKGGSNKIGTRYKEEGMKAELNLLDIFKSDPGEEFSIKVGNELKTYKVKGIIEVLGDLFSTKGESSKDKNFLTVLFDETINPMIYTKGSKFDWFKAQYHYLTPTTDRNTPVMCAPLRDWRNLNGIFEKGRILLYIPFLFMNPTMFLKSLFVIISFPFTLLQILANNVRLSIPVRVASIIGWFKNKLIDAVKALTFSKWTALFIALLWIIIIALLIGMFASLVIVTVIIVKYGITGLLELSKTGVLPNKNYVDPIDGVTHKDENSDTFFPAAAVWPRRLYREEWDDMIKDPISDEVVQQRESLLPDILQGSINDKDNVTDAYKIAYMELEPESLNWTQSLRDLGTYYNNFVNRLGDNFLFTFILAPYIIYKYITSVSDYFPKEGEVFQIKDVLLYTVAYAIIFGVVSVIMSRSEPVEGEYDGVEKKCYDDIPSPFSLGDGTPINYPKLCYGDSLDEDKDECPYGCYYIGDGTASATNPDYGKKCKDNRSGLSLGWIFEPEPRLNLPISDIDIDDESKGKWYKPDGEQYACPPKSRFLGKYPYDSLCATTAKRCKAADSLNNLIIDSDDFCESLYMLNNHNDTQCNSSFIDGGEMTQSQYLSKSDELARGPITENGIEPAVRCELHTPYTSDEGYSTDIFCPFPLPAGENVLYAQSSDPEDNLRSSIPLWTYLYDKITNRTSGETCTYLCENPNNCTSAENTFRDYCNNVDMNSDSSKTPEEICTSSSTDGRNCRYFPENIPLQMSMQNQERYYIVNQEYGQNLFS